jgi:hypothetical protein
MPNRIAFSLGLILSLGSGAAAAQEIPNWPAPPFWQGPTRPSAPDRPDGERVRGTFSAPDRLPFVAITPCRVMDTRGGGQTGAFGPPTFAANEARNVPIPSHPVCTGIPSSAGAYSLNITVTNTGASPFGFIKAWPQGATEPNVSTLNWSSAGQTVANAAVVPASFSGITIRSGNASADVIIDINGYYSYGPGVGNVALGIAALANNTSGTDNVATGILAAVANTTGSSNTAVGAFALESASTANNNTCLGFSALANTTAGNNTAVGYNAGSVITTGAGNILIGPFAGSAITSGSSNILIGSAGSGNESNTIRIGDTANQNNTVIVGIAGQTAVGGVPVLVTGGGRLGTTTSSRRYKRDIHDIAGESDGLMKLRPVAFRYKEDIDPTNLVNYGLIAEEVADIYPDLVANGPDGKPQAVRYHELNALLLNELQKQQHEIARQKDVIDRLQARLAEIEKRLQ